MRLYKRHNGIYYIRFQRGVERSTGTKDEAVAQNIFDEIKRQKVKEQFDKLDKKNGATLDQFRVDYIKSRRDELDDDTTRADDVALRALSDVLGKTFYVTNIDKNSINDFKKVCLRRGLSKISINTYLRHIKAALRSDLAAIQEPAEIKFFKIEKRLPEIVRPEHFPFILDRAFVNDYDMWRIIRFGMWTGCRREEILLIKYEDLQMHAGESWLKIHGKGNKQRSIYLLEDALYAMEPIKASGYVFAQLHKDTVSKRFKAIVRACGFSQYKFHNLRHSAGTQMLACGIPIPVIQKILGHADIQTTMIYAQVLDNLVVKQMQKFKY